jgi:hypothetical protein
MEAEAAVRQRFDLSCLERAFGLRDFNTDETTVVAKSTEIGRLDLKTFSLIVRPSESCTCPDEPTSASADCGEVREADRDADGEVLLRSLGVSCGSVRNNIPVYQFVCLQHSEEFELRLAIGTKVSSVREMIGRRYGVPAAAVTLHAFGKALRDGFVMDRLRIGTSKVSVHLQDNGEIVLLTARANMS